MLMFVVFVVLGCAAIVAVRAVRLPTAAPIRLDRRVQLDRRVPSEAGSPDMRGEGNDSRTWDGYGYRNC
jgi:hypothetical protein